jgi:hypothetical protein
VTRFLFSAFLFFPLVLGHDNARNRSVCVWLWRYCSGAGQADGLDGLDGGGQHVVIGAWRRRMEMIWDIGGEVDYI